MVIVIIRVALTLQALITRAIAARYGIIRRPEHRADPAVGGEIAES